MFPDRGAEPLTHRGIKLLRVIETPDDRVPTQADGGNGQRAGEGAGFADEEYVAEGADLEVTAVLDEPSAANAVYQISDGVIVDIGGGTTGLAILHGGKVTEIADEPTGGTHLTLVLAGNYHIPFAEAEKIKQDYSRHREILPVLKPVIEKMASIIRKNVNPEEIDTIYLCGGTCCLTGMETVIVPGDPGGHRDELYCIK